MIRTAMLHTKLIYLVAFLSILLFLTACGQEVTTSTDIADTPSTITENSPDDVVEMEHGVHADPTTPSHTPDEASWEELNGEPSQTIDNEPSQSETVTVINEPPAKPDGTNSEETENAPSQTEADPSVDEPTSEPDEPLLEQSNQVYNIEIANFAYSPSTLEIRRGDTVVFINKDSVKHGATADDGSFDTGLLAQDEKGEITFAEVGEFPYYCLPHPGMKGMIVVIE